MQNVATKAGHGKTLDPEKLARICGLFSSDHPGERSSAASLADRMVRDAGLTWPDVLQTSSEPRSLPELCGWILARSEALSFWEQSFVASLRPPLSPKQRDKLDGITRKVRAYVRRATI